MFMLYKHKGFSLIAGNHADCVGLVGSGNQLINKKEVKSVQLPIAEQYRLVQLFISLILNSSAERDGIGHFNSGIGKKHANLESYAIRALDKAYMKTGVTSV